MSEIEAGQAHAEWLILPTAAALDGATMCHMLVTPVNTNTEAVGDDTAPDVLPSERNIAEHHLALDAEYIHLAPLYAQHARRTAGHTMVTTMSTPEYKVAIGVLSDQLLAAHGERLQRQRGA